MKNWIDLKVELEYRKNAVAIGDEFTIELKTGEQVTLVCELVEGKHATFFTKDLLEDTHAMNENWITGGEKQLSTMDGYLEKLFRLLPEDLQAVICGGKLRLLREREVFGQNVHGEAEDCEQLPRYKKSANRVKCLNGVPFPYWLASPYASNSNGICNVSSDGAPYCSYANNSYGVCFGFDI